MDLFLSLPMPMMGVDAQILPEVGHTILRIGIISSKIPWNNNSRLEESNKQRMA